MYIHWTRWRFRQRKEREKRKSEKSERSALSLPNPQTSEDHVWCKVVSFGPACLHTTAMQQRGQTHRLCRVENGSRQRVVQYRSCRRPCCVPIKWCCGFPPAAHSQAWTASQQAVRSLRWAAESAKYISYWIPSGTVFLFSRFSRRAAADVVVVALLGTPGPRDEPRRRYTVSRTRSLKPGRRKRKGLCPGFESGYARSCGQSITPPKLP